MSFIVKKKVGNNDYYYLRKSVRENGKVKAITVAYLGKTKKEAERKKKEIELKKEDITKNLQVIEILGSTLDKVKERKYNIYVGISLGNKWFTKENIRKHLHWALKYTKERVGLLIGDTLHAVNYEVRNNEKPDKARKRALKEGDKFVTLLNDLISELPKKNRERVDVIRWDEVKNQDFSRKFLPKIYEEYENNKEFREAILNIVKEYLNRPGQKKFSEKEIRKLGTYIVEELPELLHGFNYKGVYYNCYTYPHSVSLHKFVDRIQKREIFPELFDKLKGKENVSIAIDSMEEIKNPQAKKPFMSQKVSQEEKDFLSFVQEAGLIWGPEPEIYGGLAGFYTYGPLGKLLKNKVENSVRKVFNKNGFRELEGPTVLPDVVWKASGHLDTFNDPLILTEDGKESYRADKLLEDVGINVTSLDDKYLLDLIKKNNLKAPSGKALALKIERYSLMMKTKVSNIEASLRPETATVTYLPFLRTYNYFRKKLPFAIYQIGKAYRNEISPRQSVLRGREFTQAEGQIFVDPEEKNNWEKFDEIKSEVLPVWSAELQKKNGEVKNLSLSEMIEKKLVKSKVYAWCLYLAYKQFESFGVPRERIRLRQHGEDEKAFYADDAWDVEIQMKNYGWTEVCGVHDRTDYDLKQHAKHSGEKLEAIRENGERFVPHVLEIAFGTDRPTYALIDLFYDKKTEDEGKTTFKIPKHMSPIDVSVFPLMKKPDILKLSLDVKEKLEDEFIIDYDISGSIGKRYLRSMSAGTPFAVTIDYDSLTQEDVTVRDRDSGEQERVKISELVDYVRKKLN